VGTLTDDFNGAVINSTLWTSHVDSPCTLLENGGNVTFQGVSPLTTCAFNLTSKISYDFREGHAHLEVPDVQVYGQFRLVVRSGADEIRIGVSGSAPPKLVDKTHLNSIKTTPFSINYDSLSHKWLRLSEAGGTVTWSTSPDDTVWTPQYDASTSDLFSMACVVVEINGHTPNSSFHVQFDNFNL